MQRSVRTLESARSVLHCSGRGAQRSINAVSLAGRSSFTVTFSSKAGIDASAGDVIPSSESVAKRLASQVESALNEPYDPTMDVPQFEEDEAPLLSERWERRRLSWMVTNSKEGPPPGSTTGQNAAIEMSALAARLSSLRRARKRKAVKVNVKSILAVMTDPSRAGSTITFTKPLPLPHMVAIMTTAWGEEGLYGTTGGAAGTGAAAAGSAAAAAAAATGAGAPSGTNAALPGRA